MRLAAVALFVFVVGCGGNREAELKLQAEADALRAKAAELAKKNDELKREVRRLTDSNSKINGEVKALEEERTALRARLSAATHAAESAEQAAAAAKAQYAADQVTMRDAHHTELESLKRSSMQEISRLYAEVGRLTADIARLNPPTPTEAMMFEIARDRTEARFSDLAARGFMPSDDEVRKRLEYELERVRREVELGKKLDEMYREIRRRGGR